MTETTQDVNTEAEVQDADAEQTTDNREQDSQPTGFDALPRETQDEIKKLRRENASYRNKVKSFEDEQKTEAQRREDALQEAQDRAARAEERAQRATGKAAVMNLAPKAGAISANAVYAMIAQSIEFDDDGEPTNVSDLLDKCREDEPDLFRTPSGDGGKGAAVSNQDMNALIRRAAGRK